MRKELASRYASFNLRVLIGLVVFFSGVLLALFATAKPKPLIHGGASRLDAQVRAPNGFPVTSSGAVQEEWVARYNGPDNSWDVAVAIAIDGSGNVFVTGHSEGTNPDYATIKYNSAGQEEWAARYDGPGKGVDLATAIAVDAEGNVYVTGESRSEISFNYATIKYNPTGEEQWVARSGLGTRAVALAIDNLGNVYVTGEGPGATHSDYVTIKYNPAGEEQWVGRYHGPGVGSNDFAKAIAIDSSGNVYVTGQSAGAGTFESDYGTIKYNSQGQEQWVARYDGPGDFDDDAAKAIAIDSSGNVYVTGFSFGPGKYDYATIKYNPIGEEQWVARYDGDLNDLANAIAVDGSANVYVTGVSERSGMDYATIKYDSAGQEQWVSRYHASRGLANEAGAIAVDNSSNVYVTGFTDNPSGFVDYATIKYDSVGKEQWVAIYDGPGTNDDVPARIAVDSSENVYVTGRSFGLDGNFDYATIKYVQGPTPTATPAPTSTSTPTSTPTATATPTATPTATSTPTTTATPAASPTPRPTPIPGARPTPAPRPTPMP